MNTIQFKHCYLKQQIKTLVCVHCFALRIHALTSLKVTKTYDFLVCVTLAELRYLRPQTQDLLTIHFTQNQAYKVKPLNGNHQPY